MTLSDSFDPEVGVIAAILRVYCYLYHFVLSLLLLAISTVAISSGEHTLKLPMLPWEGAQLETYLLWMGLAGTASVLLAVTGAFRYLLPLWALFAFVMMFRGFLILPYTFSGKDQFEAVLWLIAGAFGAFLSSLTLFSRRRR